MVKKAFSFVETLIALCVLGVIMLSLADFSVNLFNIYYDQSKQVENVNQSRISASTITDDITRAAYIYPAGQQITLSGDGINTFAINTNSAVAVLIDDGYENGSHKYIFKAFYLEAQDDNISDLYQFCSDSNYVWTENTSPAYNMRTFTGSVSFVASDIKVVETQLNYIINYDNGITDSVLKGSVTNVTANSTTALIKGIDWNLLFHKNTDTSVKVKGISRNVPRFIQENI